MIERRTKIVTCKMAPSAYRAVKAAAAVEGTTVSTWAAGHLAEAARSELGALTCSDGANQQPNPSLAEFVKRRRDL